MKCVAVLSRYESGGLLFIKMKVSYFIKKLNRLKLSPLIHYVFGFRATVSIE